VSLADVFTRIEQNKKQFQIVDYAVSQTSLEQVFLSFAKLQEDEFDVSTPKVNRRGCCWRTTTKDDSSNFGLQPTVGLKPDEKTGDPAMEVHEF
jgi:hypothetical protein